MEIRIKGQLLRVLPQKAVLWVEENTLLISDVHLGKIMHFRREGIAVPESGVAVNFSRLDEIMQQHDIRRILFLGDLFHSDLNYEWELFTAWRRNYPSVDMHIILGNHDNLPLSLYHGVPLQVHQEELTVHPFTFTHHPREYIYDDQYIISGHVHPVIKLYGKGNDYFRLPCFYFAERQAILPGFGYFTGGYAIDPASGETVIAIANNKLFDVSALL